MSNLKSIAISAVIGALGAIVVFRFVPGAAKAAKLTPSK